MNTPPLILITNDDGIDSPGLHALAGAVADLGDLLIMAPSAQQTSTGRSHPPVEDGAIYRTQIPLAGGQHPAYTAAFTPAQAVLAALLEIADRPVDLCLSGINYGENIGSGITISGTVGAALEAACVGIPAIAASFQTSLEDHYHHNAAVDFGIAAHFTRLFAQQILAKGLPSGVDLLKLDVPAGATPRTPWRTASISRQPYFHVRSERSRLDEPKYMSYFPRLDPEKAEPDSDIYVFSVRKEVSVVPMSFDMTAPVPLAEVTAFFK